MGRTVITVRPVFNMETYEDNDSGAADALEQGAGADDKGQFYLPEDFPGSGDCKAGDILKLRVVGKSAEGDIQVELVSEGKEPKPMSQDLRESGAFNEQG